MSATGTPKAVALDDLSVLPDLLDEHVVDLKHSGLLEPTWRAARVKSMSKAAMPSLLGPRLAEQVRSALLIPYDEHGLFWRAKLFPPVANSDGYAQRYHQAPASQCRLYVPPDVRPLLADPTRPLLVIEGEKKALRAWQEGLASVAIGGVWSWRHNNTLIEDFARIDLCDRPVILVPDSDVWSRTGDLLHAVYALGRALEERGAQVTVCKLPPNPDGTKGGLDDYFVTSGMSVATFEALPRLELKHKVFGDCATWFKAWRKRKSNEAARQATALELLNRAETGRRLHPAQDVHNGVLSYALPVDGALVAITSAREMYTSETLPAGIALRHTDVGAAVSVTRDVALRFLSKGARGSVAAALDGIAEHIKRHMAFRDRRAPLWLAAWALGTWCYRAFPAYPYLHLRSAEKACGKTRLMELMAGVAFNATAGAAPTEAVLFREAERRSGTQCFDEAETLAGDDDKMIVLLGILNAGYRQGGTVQRMEKQGERFVAVDYEVYCPRILAGLAALKETLDSRALPLVMVRRRRDEPITRISRETAAAAARLRDLCALACLEHITHILASYNAARDLLEREVDDRAEELLAPLLALALVADAEDPADRVKGLLAVAREIGAGRNAAEDETKTARLVTSLQRIREERGKTLRSGDLLGALHANGWDGLKSTRGVAALLGPLGFTPRNIRVGDKIVKGYSLDGEMLDDLQARFCPPATPGETQESPE